MNKQGFSLIELVLATGLLLLLISGSTQWMLQQQRWRQQHGRQRDQFNHNLQTLEQARVAANPAALAGVTVTELAPGLRQLDAGPLRTWVYQP